VENGLQCPVLHASYLFSCLLEQIILKEDFVLSRFVSVLSQGSNFVLYASFFFIDCSVNCLSVFNINLIRGFSKCFVCVCVCVVYPILFTFSFALRH